MLWLTCGQAHLCLSPSKPRAKVPEKVSVHTFGDQQTCPKFNVAVKKSPKTSLQEHAEICVLFSAGKDIYTRGSPSLSRTKYALSAAATGRGQGPGLQRFPNEPRSCCAEPSRSFWAVRGDHRAANQCSNRSQCCLPALPLNERGCEQTFLRQGSSHRLQTGSRPQRSPRTPHPSPRTPHPAPCTQPGAACGALTAPGPGGGVPGRAPKGQRGL